MKTAVYFLLLVLGFAAAKPYESPEDEERNIFYDFVEKILDEQNDQGPTGGPNQGPTTGRFGTRWTLGTDGPTGGPTGGPTDGPTAGPTGKPMKNFWEKFAHFLFVKSVQGVKPDPDLKYKEPIQKLVERLLDVKKEVVKALKPIVTIANLMIEDEQEMGRRIYEAAKNNDIEKAKYIAGQYFIAIQRRVSMIAVEASNKGLFDDIDEGKKEVENLIMKRAEYKKDGDEQFKVSKFILKNFNQFRVNDGLLDAPFVKLGIQTARVFVRAGMQGAKVVKTAFPVYTDIISKLVWLSLDKNNHDAAVRAAGSSLLSFSRRATKVELALYRMYGPKKCYGPKPNKGRKKGKKGDKDDDESEDLY